MERTTLFELFRSFFKIGLFTFGGGYAMVPLIEAEIIERRRWLPQGEFLDLLTLAQSSPGPIAVNTSVFIGYKVRGLREGQQVQKLLLLDPLAFGDQLAFDQRQHGVAASEGEYPDFQERDEYGCEALHRHWRVLRPSRFIIPSM